jgi:hypothetical protein
LPLLYLPLDAPEPRQWNPTLVPGIVRTARIRASGVPEPQGFGKSCSLGKRCEVKGRRLRSLPGHEDSSDFRSAKGISRQESLSRVPLIVCAVLRVGRRSTRRNRASPRMQSIVRDHYFSAALQRCTPAPERTASVYEFWLRPVTIASGPPTDSDTSWGRQSSWITRPAALQPDRYAPRGVRKMGCRQRRREEPHLNQSQRSVATGSICAARRAGK